MWIGAFDVPLAVGLGAVSAYCYQRRLRRHSTDWYPVLALVCVGLLWLGPVVSNATTLPYWAAPVSVPSVVGLPYALAYPLWFRAGGETAFLLFGRRAEEGGLLWVVRLTDRTESITPAWESGGTDRDRE